MTTRQAKCTTCKVRWMWHGAQPRVMDAICPVCGKALERTSQNVHLPAREASVVRGHIPYSGGVGPMLSVPRTMKKHAE